MDSNYIVAAGVVFTAVVSSFALWRVDGARRFSRYKYEKGVLVGDARRETR